ncbi:hypothetical protein SAMN02745975_00887 [Geosporobacter subterraneus DSM 17957]|uniref:DUF7916 domain-containing protein n=1 Tax=Geosporobacter subterraneus DSM 17957 TaxID=1121919 RepID=A0A1M6F2P0_9FIRM|nr:PEP phosphonomutase [Geosporobacter subterraneus]SHI91943.1 hypothetical protein SAMN02745975_00887 [Geosporobacter subterraneus DSM 17957]
MDRILDMRPKDLVKLDGKQLLDSIRAAEGRTIICEILCPVMPLLFDVTNAELVAAFGADIILLNFYDTQKPAIFGITPQEGESPIEAVKRLSGRAVGVNLEPVDPNKEVLGQRSILEPGRIATRETMRRAYEQGAQIITLTGNPKTGVSNDQIERAIREAREELGDRIIIIAGKMHSAGTGGEMSEGIVNKSVIGSFLNAGADIILLPAPGTVPGITLEFVKEMGDFIHQRGGMLLTTIGTSQEGSDGDTVKSIALYAKMAGADCHHIGDAGYTGIAVPENIMTYSVAIRGRRHTYRRMAMRG